MLGALRDAGRFEGSLAVEFSGASPGVVYLRSGRVVRVDAGGVPDLRTRLVRAARPAVAEPMDDIRRSVLLDGALAVLGSVRAAPEVRLRPDVVAHPVDRDFTGVTLPEVLEIVAGRRARLDAAGVDPDVPLTLRTPDRRAAVVDAAAWEVAGWVDGHRTARDVAWHAGLELYSTVLAAGRLVAAGLCATPRLPPPAEWADDLLTEVEIGPELIQRLIDGIRLL